MLNLPALQCQNETVFDVAVVIARPGRQASE